MSKSTRSAVVLTPARVREMHREGLLKNLDPAALPSLTGGPQGRGRGRVHKAAIEAALKASPKGSTYGEKTGLDARTVEVPMFSTKTGRPVKPVTKTLTEVREAAGIVGKKGRVSRDDLHRAALKFGSGEPAPAKAKPAPKAKVSKPAPKVTKPAPKATATAPTEKATATA